MSELRDAGGMTLFDRYVDAVEASLGYAPTLKCYQATFAMLRNSGHPLPVGIILDYRTAERLWAEFGSISWSSLGPFNPTGEIQIEGVRFRW